VVPNWSRDGKSIYFASNRTGRWQVWKTMMDFPDTPLQVTQDGGFAAREAQDGRGIYYAKGRAVTGLWHKQFGGPEKEVLPLRAALWGYWTLGSGGIYFVEPDEYRRGADLMVLPFRGTPRRIAALPQSPIFADGGLSVAHDDSFLLFAQIDESGSDLQLADYSAR
jgi:hypothetical protein